MVHLKGFGLENFRVFGNETWFDFAPITIFTGTNSSGKSSVNKALLLIKENFNNTTNVEFKVNENSFTQLGRLNNIKNRKSKSIKFQQKIWNKSFKIAEYEFTEKEFYVEYTLNEEEAIPIQNERNLFLKEFKIWDENDWVLKLNFDYDSKKGVDEEMNITSFLDVNFGCTYSINYNYLWKLFNLQDSEQNSNSKLFIDIYNVLIEDKFTIKQLQKIESKLFSSKFGFSNMFPIENDYNFIEDITGSLFGNKNWYDQFFISENPIYEKFISILKEEFENVNDLSEESYIDDLFTDEGKVFNKRLPFLLDEFINTIKKISNNIFYIKLSNVNINRLHSLGNQENNFYNVISRFNTDLLNINTKKSSFYNKWSKKFDIKIDIQDVEGVAYNVLVNNNNIADLGAGITKLVDILLNIFLNDNCIIIIEEPESNLHPALQSKLADMFAEASKLFNIQFIIETHSEYLIRRFQYLTAKKEIKPKDTIIHYLFDPKSKHVKMTKEQLRTIRIQADGRLDKEFGTGFFDESTKLIESIWNIASRN